MSAAEVGVAETIDPTIAMATDKREIGRRGVAVMFTFQLPANARCEHPWDGRSDLCLTGPSLPGRTLCGSNRTSATPESGPVKEGVSNAASTMGGGYTAR